MLKDNLATGLIILAIAPVIGSAGCRGAPPGAAAGPRHGRGQRDEAVLITVSIVGVALLCLVIGILGRSAPGALS